MTETNPQPTRESQVQAKPFKPILEEDQTFAQVLKNHLGEVFLIANPESFEEGGLGPQIKAGWYKAKLIGLGADYLILLTQFTHGSGKKATKEPTKQYIPTERIKRLSVMKSERLLHL